MGWNSFLELLASWLHKLEGLPLAYDRVYAPKS